MNGSSSVEPVEPDDDITSEGERYVTAPDALRFLELEPPRTGSGLAIAAGLHWLRIPLPMELNHINVWLLDDGDGWTLVDTGMADEVCRAAWLELEAHTLGRRRLKRIVITHDHPDHMGLAAWLAERHGAAVWMSEIAYSSSREFLAADAGVLAARIREFLRRHGVETGDGAKPADDGGRAVGGERPTVSGGQPVTAERPTASDGQPVSSEQHVHDNAKPAAGDHRRWFGGSMPLAASPRDGDVLEAGGARWTVIETAGHCRGHLCLYDAERRLLVSGDQVLPSISPNVSVHSHAPDADPLRDFLASLERLCECHPDTLVLPSHGRPFRGLHRRIADLADHHRQQLDALLATADRPRTAFEVLPVMFRHVPRGFHRMLAIGEAVAHLNYLCGLGRMERQVDATGVARFVASSRDATAG
jgi:glyoxylase-like metal-dependent hydrolase (beta-lactamase superfamily II)